MLLKCKKKMHEVLLKFLGIKYAGSSRPEQIQVVRCFVNLFVVRYASRKKVHKLKMNFIESLVRSSAS